MQYKINIIIFSKNRACQLDSLLKSLEDNYEFNNKVSVIFKSTSDFFSKGYNLLKRKYPKADFLNESVLKTDIIKVIEKENSDLVQFFVDDNIVYKKMDFSILDYFKENHCFLSLRLSEDHDYGCPVFTNKEKYLEWKWYRCLCKYGWDYPFSVDGNIYYKEDILKRIKATNFKGPNTFEQFMCDNFYRDYIGKELAMALKSPCVFNNPLNKVQTECETKHGKVFSSEHLNDLFLNGYEIDNNVLYNATPYNYHYLIENKLVKK